MACCLSLRAGVDLGGSCLATVPVVSWPRILNAMECSSMYLGSSVLALALALASPLWLYRLH